MSAGEKIGRRQFAEGMALLSERYNRELSPGLSAVYLEEALAAGLTGDEFVAGVKGVIRECEFFPTSGQLVQFARPTMDPAVAAGEVFTAILNDRRLRHQAVAGEVWSIAAIADLYGEVAARAVLAVGGVRRLARLTEQDLPFVLRDYREAFASASRESLARHRVAHSIGAGVEQRRVASGATRAPAGLESVADVVARALPAGEPTP